MLQQLQAHIIRMHEHSILRVVLCGFTGEAPRSMAPNLLKLLAALAIAPSTPSHTSAARRKACAEYRNRNKEELWEKAHIRMARHCARIKNNPITSAKHTEAGHEAVSKYESKLLMAEFVKMRAKRKAAEEKKLEGPRDYELEWAVYQERKKEKFMERVAEVMYIPGPHEVCIDYAIRSCQMEAVEALLLVTFCVEAMETGQPPVPATSPATSSQALLPKPQDKMLTEFTRESVQRVAEGIPHGGGIKYECYNECLPAWHEGCDAGEHDHPPNPAITAGPQIAHRICAIPHQKTAGTPRHRQHHFAPTTPRHLDPAPHPAAALSSPFHAISGSGVVHTLLSSVLQQFDEVAATCPTALLTTEDTRQAIHFAAGHSKREAKALADGERLAEGLKAWVGGSSPGSALLSDAARREKHRAFQTQIVHAISLMQLYQTPVSLGHRLPEWSHFEVKHLEVQTGGSSGSGGSELMLTTC
ncbi:hypothetical protein B0H19DRAFT_1086010 [Mycena capillaripes]|nr:hypothetical protein B0H19DRAFT_1086010 [Mycena capillaripes]